MTPSWQARVAAFVVRRRVKPALADLSDIARVRRVFDQPLPTPGGARYTAAVLGGVPGEWVEAAQGDAADTTLLYLHGGGFVGCSPHSHRSLTAALALQGLRVFVPDYRLAPEHPFPAAVLDVQAAWHALRAEVPGRLVVAGDSAGGNLALGLMLALRDAGEPLPDAAVLFSPSTDLVGDSPSLRDNSERDAMFDGEQLDHLAVAYLAGADRAQPLASPLRGDLRGLPPLMLQVGEDEVLRDDSLRLAQKAREAGVVVDLEVFPVVPHVWQLLWRLPEARRAVRNAARFLREASREHSVERHDVIIVGAGLSGIGAAVHLQRHCPDKRFALLEARDTLGGTWDLFRYPGVRSDSDMYTLGYVFKPWQDAKAMADGPAILRYIAETAAEHRIDRHIRFRHRVLSADWSEREACWTLVVERGAQRERSVMRCNFLLFCSGYYSYAQGYRPTFPGEQRFTGTLVHPQFWPEALDHAGKRVVVIGSGATAVTLVPEMAKSAAHVTMLQRSPSYVVALPSRDAIAEALKRWLPAITAYRLVRLKNVLAGLLFYGLARRYPDQAKARLTGLVQRQLGAGYDVARHFTPHYKPWDQRVCLAPDGDLFRAIREGRASVVTDHIDSFTERGIRLQSGQELDADIVVTATGLQLNLLGDVKLSLDGRPCDLSQALVYKGMMFSGIPNLASTFGYTNASWTLKADLSARYVCRLLKHMDRRGFAVATPERGPDLAPQPFLGFSSGYVRRAIDSLPKQGDRKPWRLYQNYLLDLRMLRWGRVDDGVIAFGRGDRP
ncbi:alpha/beta hydrolase fold domain-containing protein [uncultured Piscinibacter sp.]|uniref:alpha/beta hydrolase fold domain-containing protein n=1 Tax=uncultured Piscinibacter sp. TaxID=1131835 RepID=UPI002613553B|nr:alpha/beta hydrolase fold domain-containing protein [uncultured Piscinibacter sp.]